jgi:hypothetical protein
MTLRGDVCRFFKPEMLVETSDFVGDYSFNFQRNLGHEYMNTFSIILSQLFRCNHDIKILKGAQALNNVYYVVK